MKQLDFTLSLIDKLSRPLKQVQGNVTGFAEKSKAAFMQIGGGAVALAGVGMAIKGALSPAIEMYDALNDAAAKGLMIPRLRPFSVMPCVSVQPTVPAWWSSLNPRKILTLPLPD